jgi:type IV pilus assembly protein PilV
MRLNLYRSQTGSSLLEVLITMLIMSFGLLALSGLTASSLQYSKMAQFQTIGSQLAIEYGDRMRGNVAGFQAGNYNKTDAYTGATSAVTVPACGTPAKCTPAEVAAIDIAEWTNLLRQRLPGGGAYVLRDAANPLSVDIWVMWVEANLDFNGSSDTLSVSATGGNQCPAAAGTASVSPAPRCMYFRVSL